MFQDIRPLKNSVPLKPLFGDRISLPYKTIIQYKRVIQTLVSTISLQYTTFSQYKRVIQPRVSTIRT